MLIQNALVNVDNEAAVGWMLVEGGLVVAIGHGELERSAAEVIDALGGRLMPGFVDVHNHGAVGIDVNSADVTGLMEVAAFLATKGVTGWLPTLVPDSDENYRRAIGAIDKLMEVQTDRPIAQALGVHYEGVFASEQMCGALRPEFFKRFTGTELDELPRLRRGVHMTTYAPEIEGGIELTRELRRQGWVASIGHTKATPELLDEAFAAGARHFTHFFNAMTGLHHRDVGVVGWALANPETTFDIISDGIHVHASAIKVACRSKGTEGVSLISDSVAPTGLGDGTFELWGEKITVESGRTRNERGSIAGSVITMIDAVRRMRELGFDNVAVAKMAAANPARLLGVDSERGGLDVGKRADMVAIDPAGEIAFVMIGGRMV